MSYKHLNAAYEESNSSGLTKFVLVYLAGASNEHGICWPSVSCIAKKCAISEATTHRAIKELAELGEIRIYEKGGPIAGKNISNHYEVVVSQRDQGGVTVTPRVVSHRHPNHNIESPLNIRPPIVPQGDEEVSKNGKARKEKLTVELVLKRVLSDLTLSSSDFLEAWTLWVRNRLELPKPTLGAFEEHMRICERLGQSRAIAAIHHSIASNWLSIFEPRSSEKTAEQRKQAKWGSL